MDTPDNLKHHSHVDNDVENDKKNNHLLDDDLEEQEQHDQILVRTEETTTMQLLGCERRQSEIREMGGLLGVLGLGAAFSTLRLLAELIDGMVDAKTQYAGFALPLLVSNVLQLLGGLLCMMTGTMALLGMATTRNSSRRRQSSFHRLVKASIAMVNLGPITLVLTIMRLCQQQQQPDSSSMVMMMPSELTDKFIPAIYDPTMTDTQFCAIMGMLVLISVCCTLIGGLTVLGLHLSACLGGVPHSRHCAYHVLRLGYYSILVILGGLSQLLLGAYLYLRVGVGPYTPDPVHVATYTIHFPLVSVFIGLLQTLWGMHGLYRSRTSLVYCEATGEWRKRSKSDGNYNSSFAWETMIVWLITFGLQIVLQPSYHATSDRYHAEGPTVACVYLGFFLMPLYLDHLVQVTPVQPCPEYYGLDPHTPYDEDLLVRCFGMVPPSLPQPKSATNNTAATTTATPSIGATTQTPVGTPRFCSFHDESVMIRRRRRTRLSPAYYTYSTKSSVSMTQHDMDDDSSSQVTV